MPADRGPVWADAEPFGVAATAALADPQLRRNLKNALTMIRVRRAALVAEYPDWEALRDCAAAIKDDVLENLGSYLLSFERNSTARGATVHWARTASEANEIVTALVRETGETQVLKMKSMTTQECELNDALELAGIDVCETDLAELIIQLSHDRPSHIVVPALHKNRGQVREIFLAEMDGADPGLTDDPHALAEAARLFLRRRFAEMRVAITGANFAIAETGALAVVESEGNGRMCLTLPDVLISVVGIEKLLPSFRDLGIFMQLLAPSATGERLSPYNSLWTGVTPGDGPQQVHIVLLDNGRLDVREDAVGRQALRCIRCAACLNVCPVYERTGGHAYGSTYPGPIGAVITPQLAGVDKAPELPFASTLCGACYEVCPVKIDIPTVLVKLRRDVVSGQRVNGERLAMQASGLAASGARRWGAALRLARPVMRLMRRVPLGPARRWSVARELPAPPPQIFRDWWAENHGHAPHTDKPQ
jgi:L-lactate dehydrogenase complex protein LldF